METMTRKNIIFDLGGVLLNIDESLTVEAFRKILKPGLDFSRQWEHLPELIGSMETGKWDQGQFCDYLMPFARPGIEPSQLVDAWCAMILDVPVSRVNMVKELSHHAGLYLLSNTDPLHIREYEAEFLYRFGFPLSGLFTKVFYSSDIGMRKPSPEPFHHVLNEAGLAVGETLFVDDREENCRTAENLGLKAIRVPANTGLEAVFTDIFEWIGR